MRGRTLSSSAFSPESLCMEATTGDHIDERVAKTPKPIEREPPMSEMQFNQTNKQYIPKHRNSTNQFPAEGHIRNI